MMMLKTPACNHDFLLFGLHQADMPGPGYTTKKCWNKSETVAASAAEIPQPPVDNSLATSNCSHSIQEVYKGDILRQGRNTF
ncbi:uncharacterized protein LOC143731977 isoform X2 [Siphateles boraxobius]|uniref:uncharacterized protein LOC143731977 isoform X2 n=1 Tax=Siphateles boraxobius TaxID=180520 RepID=UPI004062F938